jgi:RNA polymerase sigma factor (sigma-70 family)
MASSPAALARSYASDRCLAAAVLDGDLAAWHEFVRRYSAVLYHTLRKHMIAEDEDEVRSLYVDVLHDLYHGRLASFEGRASLSTWLVLVARNVAFDRLRHLYGRARASAAWKRLSTIERRVHDLWLEQGLPFDLVRRLARPDGAPLEEQELLDAIDRIREAAPERPARFVPRGAPGSPHLPRDEFAEHLRRLHAEMEGETSPDAALVREELWRTIQWLTVRVGRLPEADREVLRLRFDEGLTARAIAARLGAHTPRMVFAWLSRLLRQLRADLERQFP